MFKIIKELKSFACKENTLHANDRAKRLTIANNLISTENGKICKICVVDKNHVNGEEVHIIFNNGIVKIYNYRTGKFITVLIAREKQMTRYNIKLTKTMRKKIKSHIDNNLNYV